MRLKRVDIRGRDTKHLVALVKTEQDKRGIVDLGPVDDLKRLKLRQGDRISFQGTPIRVGERGVLMANRVRKQGQQVRPDRARQQRQVARSAVRQSDLASRLRSEDRAERREQRRRPAMLRGRVERAKRVGVRHLDTDHLVLLLRTDQDQLRIVDLGPVENLQNVRLLRGDTIAVVGDVALVGDRSVLMARRLRKGDRDFRIGRNESQSQEGRAQARSQSRQQQQQQR